MTDADIARRLGVRMTEGFVAALQDTRHVAPLVGPLLQGARNPRLVGAGSACARIAAAEGLLAVGDAAMTFDPVTGLGIVKTLRSGMLAAYAIADTLVAEDRRGFARYQALVAVGYAAYRRRHREVHRAEFTLGHRAVLASSPGTRLKVSLCGGGERHGVRVVAAPPSEPPRQ